MKSVLILSAALLAAALPNTASTTTTSPKPLGFIGQETILPSSATTPSSSIGSQSASSPSYSPRFTEPPNQDEMLRSKTTTHYKCRTDSTGRETEDECGWHAPVLKTKGEAAGPGRGVGNLTGWVIGVGVAAGVFAMGLV